MDFQALKNDVSSSPAFVLDEAVIIKTLKNLAALRNQCGCKVLYSIKSLPFSSVMEMAKPWVDGFSVSSLFEARLADEVLAGRGTLVVGGREALAVWRVFGERKAWVSAVGGRRFGRSKTVPQRRKFGLDSVEFHQAAPHNRQIGPLEPSQCGAKCDDLFLGIHELDLERRELHALAGYLPFLGSGKKVR